VLALMSTNHALDELAMNYCRYVEDKMPPQLPSLEALAAVKLIMAHRPHAASLKEQLIKQDKKGGTTTWNWTTTLRSNRGK